MDYYGMKPYFPICMKSPEKVFPLEMRCRIQLGPRKAKMATVESKVHALEKKLLARVASITLSCESWSQDESSAADRSIGDVLDLRTPTRPSSSRPSTGDVHVTPLLSNVVSLKRVMDDLPYLPEENTLVCKTPSLKRRRVLLLARQQENAGEFPFFPCLSPRDRVASRQRPSMPVQLG